MSFRKVKLAEVTKNEAAVNDDSTAISKARNMVGDPPMNMRVKLLASNSCCSLQMWARMVAPRHRFVGMSNADATGL